MTTFGETQPGPAEADFAIHTTEDGWEVRHANAPGMEDPFVRVQMENKAHPHRPATKLRAAGPQMYDLYDSMDTRSTQLLPGYTTIEVTTPLLSPDKRIEAARRLASLVFNLSEGAA